jgi:HTH-type transcriptional regulator/antitoxin HigA
LISENPSCALFRKNQQAGELLTDLWVSKVYQKATKIFLENLSTTYVDGNIDDDYLNNTAKLSSNIESIRDLDKYFIKNGIIFLIEPYIPGSKVDGVSLKLPNGIPVIGLSLRYKRLDSFWFTLLHELAHIKLHYEQLDTPIIDDLDSSSESKIEKQANLTAKHSILSKQIFRTIDFQEIRSKASLFRLARDVNVHPALIAGIIRFHLNNYTLHSDIIHKHDVKSILEGSL